MHAWWGAPAIIRGMGAMAVLALAFASPLASAQGFAAQWLMRVTQAARTLNYSERSWCGQNPSRSTRSGSRTCSSTTRNRKSS
jgi:negative regulator of sigma E activity